MNYITCIVQILEIPVIQLYDNTIEKVQFRVQLPYVRNKGQSQKSPILVNSVIWGNLAYDIVNYYHINDYALIEGYISTSLKNNENKGSITINIIKLYPFLFSLE